MNRITLTCIASLLLLAAVSCEPAGPAIRPACESDCCSASAALAPASRPAEIPTTGVHEITLPVIESELPAAPGKLTVMSACTQCHSPRYLTIQPAFPRKTWIAEVDKMKKVYGAPILDDQVEPIVKYLVAIRGNGQ